jgi:hypothetical protein
VVPRLNFGNDRVHSRFLMDVSCNCFGVATAAKVPVKRYNLLVPAIFPVTEPNPDKALSIGIEKNIHRLSDYLERNEHRIPKASRRLARSVHDYLKRKKFGYVRVGVEAFQVLVHACESRFARLYAQELLLRFPKKATRFESLHREQNGHSGTIEAGKNRQYESSVVGALLANKDVRAQKMGIELLLSILKTQDSAEYIASLDNFVPMLCRLATDESRGVSAIALQCLLEHLRLCTRISYTARNMDAITSAVLEIIEHDGDSAIAAYEAFKSYTLGKSGVWEHPNPDNVVNPLALGRLSIGSRIGASPPCQAAVLIFKEIGSVSHESVESRNIVEYWINFLDRDPSRWSQGAALHVGLGVLRDCCTIEHQKYALACSLVRHLSLKSSSAEEKYGMVNVVISQAELLGSTHAAALLLLAIRTLGSMESIDGIENHFGKSARLAVQNIACQVGCRAQVATVIEAALLHSSHSSSVVGTVFLCEAASSVYLDIPIRPRDPQSPGPEDLTVTESMVTAITKICSECMEENVPFILMHSLLVLRHTLEATAPGVHTSERAARALMRYMWLVLGHSCASPAIFVALQALFRSFTETDISNNHGFDLSVLFLASLNREIHRSHGLFCNSTDVSACQVAAAAVVACGMWECLNKYAGSGQYDTFKPDVPGDALLEINTIGIAVSKADVDVNIPFRAQPVQPEGWPRVSHADVEAILRAAKVDFHGASSETYGTDFFEVSSCHSPRKTSRSIISAISQIVPLPPTIPTTPQPATDRSDGAPDAHTTPMALIRKDKDRRVCGSFASGTEALDFIAAQIA